ncbi:MAG: type II secretion system protein [Alphaproteobacteria bacterium]|nr:type II secretion system protein [Alphaproteobacteria bacterium]
MNKNNQIGRSMVEMLGVLAIIGVLSVGGIAGYSKAMAKFKYQKGLDQLQTLLSNVMQLYYTQGHLNGMSTETAIRAGLVPAEMLNGKPSTTATEIYNVFNDTVYVDSTYLGYSFPDVPSCVHFATANWSGFDISIGGGGDHIITKGEHPVSPAKAQQICNQQVTDSGGYIEIYYPNVTMAPTTPN